MRCIADTQEPCILVMRPAALQRSRSMGVGLRATGPAPIPVIQVPAACVLTDWADGQIGRSMLLPALIVLPTSTPC